MKITGKVWKFGSEIDTDELFPARYLMGGDETNQQKYQEFIKEAGLSDVAERENVPRNFLSEVKDGDVIVAAKNFGIGSSRQQAAETLEFKGVKAVVADSIHRIFFRNFWNLGCPAIDILGISDAFETDQRIEIDLEKSIVKNITTGKTFHFELKVPSWFQDMLKAGGLVEYCKKE
jgi:3-isopropylmalate/(R)-2-methylmalate dehydratase small subunit